MFKIRYFTNYSVEVDLWLVLYSAEVFSGTAEGGGVTGVEFDSGLAASWLDFLSSTDAEGGGGGIDRLWWYVRAADKAWWGEWGAEAPKEGEVVGSPRYAAC